MLYGNSAARPGTWRKARKDWPALRPGTHEGYVAWERAETIRQMITDNRQGGEHPGAIKQLKYLPRVEFQCRRSSRH
jgi:hypothetical protein